MSIRTRRNSKRGVAAAVTAALGVSLLAMSSPAGAVTPDTTGTRIAGSDRYSTSALLATNYVTAVTAATWGGNIIVASGENFPDALAAASLASVRVAPVLLVPSSGALPTATRDWLLINRSTIVGKTAPTVTIVGGKSAVSDATRDAILAVLNEGLATAKVTANRIEGTDRFATAAAVNAVTGVIGSGDSAIIVSGTNFADALSVAPLAYAKGWPIILTPGTTLGASANSTLTAFKTATGTTGKIYLVGGTAAISEGIETELVNAGFNYSQIVRVAGADRYATSAAVNSLTIAQTAGQFDGSKVALVSGEGFADAVSAAPFLAAKTGAGNGIHLQLTASSSLSTGAAGLISTLAATGKPGTLYAIGGTVAVSTATVDAATAAAKSVNMVGTATCAVGSRAVSITFPSALDATEKSELKDGDLTISGASNATNNVATPSNGDKTVTFVVPKLVAGQVVTFAGNTEANSLTKRSLSAGNCTVAADTTQPSVSVVISKQQASNNTAGTFVLEFSKPVAFKSGTSATNVSAVATGDELDLLDLTVTKADGTALTTAYSAANSSATALDGAAASAGATGYASKFLVRAKTGAGATDFVDLNDAAGVKVALAAGVAKDLAGNASTAGSGTVATTATADSTAPTFTTSVACAASAPASAVGGGLTLAANVGEAFDGKAGNGWKLSVVNQRGQVLPAVAVDATAKTVTITVEVAYSSEADIIQYVANKGLLKGWTLSDTAGALAATASAVTTSGGTDACAVTLTASEYMAPANITANATYNGVAITALTLTQGAGNRTYTTSVTVGLPGSLVAVIPAASYDLAGNSGQGTLTIAVS